MSLESIDEKMEIKLIRFMNKEYKKSYPNGSGNKYGASMA